MIDHHIALVGNPHSGLTTLFNQMTGGLEHDGGFGADLGIRTKEGIARGHKSLNVIELPGLYSLSAYTADDFSTRELLLHGKPDVIINVVDASSIQLNLYLTLQLMELEIPMVLALNMMDEVRANDMEIDMEALSRELTIPVIPIAASRNEGIHDLIHYAHTTAQIGEPPQKIDFCSGYVHTAIHTVAQLIQEYAEKRDMPLRYCCTKVVEGDEHTFGELDLPEQEKDIIQHLVDDMEQHLHTDREAAMADMRYDFIEKLCRKVITRVHYETKEHERSIKIDRVLTHRIFAIPIFIGVMGLVFYLTFGSLGSWLSDWLSVGIDYCVGLLSDALMAHSVAAPIHALIIDGVCAGVGSVLSFLPIIAVLFGCLSILEDSGYMPRVAFVMDKLLRKLGLSGRSIVPMLVGFGCSVPAIMATRSLPSLRDRHLTMALIPFFSCSAKLPIYAMFTAAFFAEHRALVMMAIYLTGVLVAVICAFLFKNTLYKGAPVPFVMVLPSYRVPAVRSVWLRMWANVKGFIKKAFTVILVATIVIWFLQSFDFSLHMVASSEDSILAAIGKFVTPIFVPLGFGDWRAATALLTGLSAKEAVISTMAVLVGATEGMTLSGMLTSIFTPLSAYAFLTFCLLYMPCIATLATIRREIGKTWYAIGVVFFQTAVAWIVACLVYNIGSLVSGI